MPENEAPADAENPCPQCGGTVRPQARFCRSCGAELTPAIAAPDNLAAPPLPPSSLNDLAPNEVTPGPSSAIGRFSDFRWRSSGIDARLLVAVLGGLLLLALVGGAAMYMTHKRGGSGEGQTLYVNRLVHMRGAPTSAGSAVLGDLHRGDAVTGVFVTAGDGVTRWLKISSAGQPDRFVWAQNLSQVPRSPLIASVDADNEVAGQTEVFAEPNSAAAPIQTEAAGTVVHVVGEVAGGWYEIELARGGVGYVPKTSVEPPSAAEASPVAQPNSIDAFNQICPRALANAQAVNFVPYIARLVTLNAQPVSSDRYVCTAEGRGITYSITVKVRCGDFGQMRCEPVMRVTTDTGKVLWQALE
jgi:hypothetical protein